ncbi:hypothetical protein P9112_003965 [Eukaryota sp. TZLM1-RC]
MSQHTRRLDTSLPHLPGTSFADKMRQTSFHKSHIFDINDGCPRMKDVPGIGMDTLHSNYVPSPMNSRERLVSTPTGETKPAFLHYDRKVLRFHAYFKEPVVETCFEQYRVRRCFIYFFLDDETLQITEPPIENSQLPQGVILSRQKAYPNVPSPLDPTLSPHITWERLNVGEELEIFGRVYMLVDCDKSTRDFLSSNGVSVPGPFSIPQDRYTDVIRQQLEDTTTYTKTPNLDEIPFRRFLKYDGKVLCFYATWRDVDDVVDDVRLFEIHYFLSEDSLEIVEVRGANSGRADSSQFLKRQKLPKNINQKEPYKELETYTWKDLLIGNEINVYNRKFLIHDVDDFTRDWYRDNNVALADPIPKPTIKRSEMERKPKTLTFTVPKHSGIGSEEDSLANCVSLVPKPVVKKAHYLINGEEPPVLRFEAEIAGDSDGRKFVLCYYCEDSTISLFEIPQHNSGYIGGVTLKRTKVPKGDGHISINDLEIGKELNVFSRILVLKNADGFTLRHLNGEV